TRFDLRQRARQLRCALERAELTVCEQLARHLQRLEPAREAGHASIELRAVAAPTRSTRLFVRRDPSLRVAVEPGRRALADLDPPRDVDGIECALHLHALERRPHGGHALATAAARRGTRARPHRATERERCERSRGHDNTPPSSTTA